MGGPRWAKGGRVLMGGLVRGQLGAARTRQQKLAADGWHRIVNGDSRSAAHEHVTRHQAGGPAPDNRDIICICATHDAALEHVPLELARLEPDPEKWEPIFGKIMLKQRS